MESTEREDNRSDGMEAPRDTGVMLPRRAPFSPYLRYVETFFLSRARAPPPVSREVMIDLLL